MSRTCGDCGSSWDGRATFCGRCGSLLDEGLVSRAAPDQGTDRWWRRRGVGAVAVAVLVAGAMAAVPRLSIERTPPVDGEIGVPEDDDLNAAPASARTRARVPDPPKVACTVDGAPVACVAWSRQVLPTGLAEQGGGWVTSAGAHLVSAGNDGFGVFDAGSGTRLWRDDELAGAFPVALSGDRVLLDTQGRMSLRDLDDGAVLWSTAAGSGFLGGAIVDAVVVTARQADDGGTQVVGRDLTAGSVVWERDLPGALHAVGQLHDGRVLLEGVDGNVRYVLLDAATGVVVSRIDVSADWVAGFVDGIGLFVSERRPDPVDPNLAGDGGATLTSVRLEDGQEQWRHELPASQVNLSIVEGAVLAPSTDRLTALDVATGEVRWELDLPGSTTAADHGSRAWWGPWTAVDDWSSVAVVHDQVGDLVRAHDLRTGAPIWERTLDLGVQHVFAADDLLMVHGGNEVTLLDPSTGDERVSVTLDGGHLAGWDPLTVFHPPSGHAARLDLTGVHVP